MHRAIKQRLHRQLDSTFLVGFHDLDFDDLAFFEVVLHPLNTLMRDLADVEQAIFARQQIDQRAKVQNLGDWALVHLANFDFSGDLGDSALSLVCLGAVVGYSNLAKHSA